MRDEVISIAKGIAIILMVVGHAEAPELLTNCIYTFHMPLFFITAGYFFNRKYLAAPFDFISRRVKGLYLPFLKWSIVFLLLHNVWFELGVLNEQYGNWTGGVTHPYTLRQALQRLVMIVTSMSGYDEFMAGAFWFFRGLMLASIAFMLAYRALDSHTRLSDTACLLTVCGGCVAFTALHVGFGFKVSVIPNGAWRETWGIFFFAVGVLYRKWEGALPRHWSVTLVAFLMILGAGKLHLSGMNNGGTYRDLWSLPLTGLVGWVMVHRVSAFIAKRDSRLRRLLVLIGDNTLYIFIFHIISFKVVSLLKIWWYDLDFGQIGCHMVIHHNHTDPFWVLYSIVGVALPLLGLKAARAVRASCARRMATA